MPRAMTMTTPPFHTGSACGSGGTPMRPFGRRFHQITMPLAALNMIIRHTASISSWLARPNILPSCSETPISTLFATAP
ncbi:hypothetical protein D3C78_1705510 [compost metagenome]